MKISKKIYLFILLSLLILLPNQGKAQSTERTIGWDVGDFLSGFLGNSTSDSSQTVINTDSSESLSVNIPQGWTENSSSMAGYSQYTSHGGIASISISEINISAIDNQQNLVGAMLSSQFNLLSAHSDLNITGNETNTYNGNSSLSSDFTFSNDAAMYGVSGGGIVPMQGRMSVVQIGDRYFLIEMTTEKVSWDDYGGILNDILNSVGIGKTDNIITSDSTTNTPSTLDNSTSATIKLPTKCNTESVTRITEKLVTYPNGDGAALINDSVLRDASTNLNGGVETLEGKDNTNNFEFFLEHGKTVRLIENGKEIKKVTLPGKSESQFLTFSQFPIDSGSYCDIISLLMPGSVGFFLNNQESAKFIYEGMNIDGNWFKMKGLIGGESWYKWTVPHSSSPIATQNNNASGGLNDLKVEWASKPDYGKVNLTWNNNASNKEIVAIERSDDKDKLDWKLIGSDSEKKDNYTDDLNAITLLEDREIYRASLTKDDGTKTYSNTTELSNCMPLSGTGPKKIVFMQGLSQGFKINDFVEKANDAINTLSSIDPYKKYFNQFSFYIDTKQYDDYKFPSTMINGVRIFAYDMSKNVINSSCMDNNSEIDIFIFNRPIMVSAFTFQFGKTIFINPYEIANQGGSLGITIAHELGHAIGGLNDEYVKATKGDLNQPVSISNLTNVFTNCSTDPGNSYRASDNKIYGSVKNLGCTYLIGNAAKLPPSYYRPSYESIMNMAIEGIPDSVGGDGSKFNIISCGYLVSGLIGEKINKDNASSHWNECFDMNTAGKSEISVN